ncbi:class E sortase [Streptomyces phaeoluteigriseus]|uniref:Class E sortase n=1 Tax=Streptomyces phaeoluteigriseus TaxID=114686 RepID=A0ABY4ZHF3_9ACTN|nr:class E sortase [Streptomyces phaeoluteigriseus]USQ88538.1 class E sortase [Streptomyces phaeoluteigriseus]
MRRPVVHHGVRRRRERRRLRQRRALWTGAELLVTAGLLGLLLVVHQLWWTNREAREGAEREVEALERQWGADAGGDWGATPDTDPPGQVTRWPETPSTPVTSGPRPPVARPAPSQAYAVLVIPRLGVRAPVAEGTSKRKVLDNGYVGHYAHTQQPGQEGNFALAGHRNTHGEPFRHLDRLKRRDTVVVETADATYTYAVDVVLAQTSPSDTGVIRPVPRSLTVPGHGYDDPGHYLTLTTCTPAYTSRYRLVVWGKLVEVRGRAA